jgi:hypothetical protein
LDRKPPLRALDFLARVINKSAITTTNAIITPAATPKAISSKLIGLLVPPGSTFEFWANTIDI